MIEKKDPHQKISPVDFDDDIIELTDEVITTPKDDDEIIDLQGTGTVVPKTPSDIPLKTDKKEPESNDEEEEDVIDRDGPPETESQAERGTIDLDEGISDYESTMGEDDILASKIVASLGTDDDDFKEDRTRLTDENDTKSEEDDDVIILNNDDGDPAAISDYAAPLVEQEEGVFDTEEEIELEYKSDEDEYDFFALDDKKTMEALETITMADEEPADAVDDDIFFDPVANLDLNSDEDDETIAMGDDPQQSPELMAFDDEETLELGGDGDLPDLIDELELEFDDEDGDIMAEDDEPGADLTAKTMEEIRALAEADGLPDVDDDMDLKFRDADGDSDIDDIGDLEPEDEVLPIEDFDDGTDEEEDGITEITEFDEYFPEENEKKVEQAGLLDALDSDEDDFLELIEVEEDDSAGDEEVIDFSNSEEPIDEDEIDSFFSETREDEPVFENEGLEPVEETPAFSTDMAMATAPSADEDEEFDFSLDSSEISMQVDRLDTFFSDDLTAEPEAASLPEEPPVEAEAVDEDQPAVEDKTIPLPVTPAQLDSILEDAIKDKFGGKIENIIYEVIEKAVSKEIARLKTALLDSTGPSDDE